MEEKEGYNIPAVLCQLTCNVGCNAFYLWLWWHLAYHNPDVISSSGECFVKFDSNECSPSDGVNMTALFLQVCVYGFQLSVISLITSSIAIVTAHWVPKLNQIV